MHPAINILTPVAAAIAMNALIFAKGWDSASSASPITRSKLLPPGPVIGAVWIAIFASLGYAHYLLYRQHPMAAWYLVAIIAWCLLYPLLTSGLQETRAKLFNTISLILAAMLCIIVAQSDNKSPALYFVLPLLAWTSYVNISDALVCSKH